MIAIFRLARKKHWILSASHLAGIHNVVANSLSRTTPLESEWSLDSKSFAFVRSKVPGLQIDLFATSLNAKLPLYVSPNQDPRATAMDALSIDWNQWEKIYLFPPVNLLIKVLDKLRTFKGVAALIAPKWQKSNWYPLVLELKLQVLPLSDPVLTQIVQQETVFASSSMAGSLHLMIFCHSRFSTDTASKK